MGKRPTLTNRQNMNIVKQKVYIPESTDPIKIQMYTMFERTTKLKTHDESRRKLYQESTQKMKT